jgi:DNA-binding NarL/FixJ family response regulator
MVQMGFTNLQIAHRLEMSEGTVRTHLNHIYARLQVTSRTAAVHEVFGISDDWPALV